MSSNKTKNLEEFYQDFWHETIKFTKKIKDKGIYWIQCRDGAKSEFFKKEYNELAWLTTDLLTFNNDLTKLYTELFILQDTKFQTDTKDSYERMKSLHDTIISMDSISEDTKENIDICVKLEKICRNRIDEAYDLSMILNIMPLYIINNVTLPSVFSGSTPIEWKKILIKTIDFLLTLFPNVDPKIAFVLYIKDIINYVNDMLDEFNNEMRQQKEFKSADQFVKILEFQKIKLQVAIYSVKRAKEYYEESLNKENNNVN